MSQVRGKERQAGWPEWATVSTLFVSAASVYLITIAHSAISFDVFGSNWSTWHLVNSGSPWIDGAHISELGDRTFQQVSIFHTSNGHVAFGRFPGVVVASVPAYVLAGSSMSTVPGSVTAGLLTAVSVCLMYLALRERLGRRAAVLVAVLFGFATPMWSVSANALWPHTITLLGIAGMAWAASSDRWGLVGIFGGIALWGRLHTVIIVAIVGVMSGVRRRDACIVLKVGVTSGAFLAASSLWVRWMYGAWNPMAAYNMDGISQDTGRYRFDVVNYLGMLVAPDRGVLIWTPIVLVLLPALARSWKHLPDWSKALVWSGVAYTALQCALIGFGGGDVFYGYRYGLELLGCLTPALAMSAPQMRALARRVAGPVLGIQFFAFALGSMNDRVTLPQEMVWRDNALVHALMDAGAEGWVMAALFALLGAVGASAWHRLGDAPESGGAQSSSTTVSLKGLMQGHRDM
jgi:alpha-1,2-mannosyltransferase